MLLLTTAALPQLQQHHHPSLGRLITPRHFCRFSDTLAAGYAVAADNDCFQGLNPAAVCAMLGAIAPWPSVAARIRFAWPWLSVPAELLPAEHLPHTHPEPALDRRAGRGRRRRRDARAVPRVAHVAVSPRKARVRPAGRRGTSRASAVGGARARRRIIGGSTRWKLGAEAAELVREARRRGLQAHMGRISSARTIRYARSIGCTSFDSSRYSRWRELLLDDGLARASQPPQLRLVP